MFEPLKFMSSQIFSLVASARHVLAVVGAAAFMLCVSSCATDSLVHVPTGEDFMGTWSQTGMGYEMGVPVTWENQTVVIEEAFGQGFAGYKEYTREGEQPQKENLNGVIGLDGKVLIVDEDGIFEGRFINGKLQGQYSEIGVDIAAINMVLTRK